MEPAHEVALGPQVEDSVEQEQRQHDRHGGREFIATQPSTNAAMNTPSWNRASKTL